jgi:hypothetical protein
MKKTLHQRILEALDDAGGQISYYALKHKIWPHDQFPKAHRHSSNGGPPGIAMVLGRALREMHDAGLIYRSPMYDRNGRYSGQPDIHSTSFARKGVSK